MIDLNALLKALHEAKEPYKAKPHMCNFCSRRHAGGKKNCRIYKSINPTTNGSTCSPKRQKQVRAMAQGHKRAFVPAPVVKSPTTHVGSGGPIESSNHPRS